MMAGEGDAVVICGKGHEDFMDIQQGRFWWSDQARWRRFAVSQLSYALWSLGHDRRLLTTNLTAYLTGETVLVGAVSPPPLGKLTECVARRLRAGIC